MRVTSFQASGYDLEGVLEEAEHKIDRFLRQCPDVKITGIVGAQTLLCPQIGDEMPEFYHVITITYVNTDMPA